MVERVGQHLGDVRRREPRPSCDLAIRSPACRELVGTADVRHRFHGVAREGRPGVVAAELPWSGIRSWLATDVVPATIEHGRRLHNMEATLEQSLAMAVRSEVDEPVPAPVDAP